MCEREIEIKKGNLKGRVRNFGGNFFYHWLIVPSKPCFINSKQIEDNINRCWKKCPKEN